MKCCLAFEHVQFPNLKTPIATKCSIEIQPMDDESGMIWTIVRNGSSVCNFMFLLGHRRFIRFSTTIIEDDH